MKKFINYIWLPLVRTVAIITFVFIAALFYNIRYVTDIRSYIGVIAVLVITDIILLGLLPQRVYPDSLEKCKEEFCDVLRMSSESGYVCGLIGAACITIGLVAISPYPQYSDKYPDARQVLEDEYNISGNTYAMSISSPKIMSEKLMASAQVMHDIMVIQESYSSTEEAEIAADEVYSKYTEDMNSLHNTMIIAAIVLVVGQVLYARYKRYYYYCRVRTAIEEAGKK